MSSAQTDPWEAAYSRFETPAQEIRKFDRRLRKLGAPAWKPESRVVELFCGRGNGLHALSRLGLTQIEGVDLSPTLLALYTGSAKCYLQDCRRLPFEDGSRDIAIVQGGLHHLTRLPDDLEQTMREVHRILRDDGLFVVVEPWRTPFLRFVHWISRWRLARFISPKIDAFAVMYQHERQTYEQWLNRGPAILNILQTYFAPTVCFTRWGKLFFVGAKRRQ